MTDTLKQTILNLDAKIPRYTSYPTAPHFKQKPNANQLVNWLDAAPVDEAISIYIHIPFCPKMCWYCGCNTKVSKQYQPVGNYVDVLLLEITQFAKALNAKRGVKHIHFGGGSPTMLSDDDFTRIMQHIRANFDVLDGCEIALEADPRHMAKSKIAAYAKNGVNRLSFGVQDFDEKVMKAVNREQSFEQSDTAIKLAREFGIDNINIDLMYGFPYQTPETMKKMVELAMLLNPDRISLFGYAHVPWMKKHMRLMPEADLPDASERYDLFMAAKKALEAYDYLHIGIDHFAKQNDPLCHAAKQSKLKRNFQGYTTDSADYCIGFGSSSISQTPFGYVQNSPDYPIYAELVNKGVTPIIKGVTSTADDKLRAEIIEEIMNSLALKINPFDNKAALQPFADKGLLKFTETGFEIIDPTRMSVRVVAAVFDAYLNPSETKHSSAI